MEAKIILEKIHIALNSLVSNDKYLLENKLNERSITHKLAEYLQPLFLEYNVDCEYNGNVADESDNKKIRFIRTELTAKLLKYLKLKDDNREIIERLVYPDIIIHRRGNSKNNLCIIEAKLFNSNTSIKMDVPIQFDEMKLEAYCNAKHGNNLLYDCGVLIGFNTDKVDEPCEILKCYGFESRGID